MSTISRADFLSIKPRTQTATLPGVDGTVTVREPTAAEMVDYSRRQQSDATKAAGWLVAQVAVDAAGVRLFSNTDADALAALPYSAMEAVLEAAMDVAGVKVKIAGVAVPKA